jgi:hypothetical protein
MSIENIIPVSFYDQIVLLFCFCYFPFSVFERFWGEIHVVFFESACEVGYHLPGFFGVGLEVFFLAFFCKLELPVMFGSMLCLQEVSAFFCNRIASYVWLYALPSGGFFSLS